MAIPQSRNMVLFTVALVAACGFQRSPSDVVRTYSWTKGNVEKTGIAWPNSDLTIEKTLAYARGFVEQKGNAPGIREVIIGPNSPEFNMSTRGVRLVGIDGLDDDPGFDQSLAAIRAAGGLPKDPIARVLKIGQAAIFSYRQPGIGNRNEAGVVEHVLLGTDDPTRLQIDQRKYRILTVADESGQYDQIPTFGLFLRSYDESSCSDCDRIARQFSDITGPSDIEVRIRSIPWFDGPYFPLVFRFEPDNSPGTLWYRRLMIPPTVNYFYRNVPEVKCSLRKQSFSCVRWDMTRKP